MDEPFSALDAITREEMLRFLAWLKMHDNSLFAILMRKGWWVSGLVAVGVFGAARIFMPWDFSAFVAAPFAIISLWVAWKQLRAPGPAGRR
jgi:hypothetical protein